jgi:hypothetical protein
VTTGQSYNGLPANIAIPGAVAILSSTAANPTVIRTNTPHGMKSGDQSDVTDHATNTGANGFGYIVTFVDSTHFSIPVDTHTYSAGGATGFVWPQAFTGNSSLLPASGDPFSYLTFRPGMANAADREAWSLTQTGIYRLANGNLGATAVHTDPAFGTPWAWIKKGAGGGSALNPVTVTSPTSGTPFGSLLHAGAIPVGGADVIECQLDFSWQLDSTGSNTNQVMYFALNCAYYVPGTGSPTFTQELPQSAKRIIVPIGTAVGSIDQGGALTLRACFNVAGNLTLQGAGAVDNAGLFDVQLYAGQIAGTSADANASVLGDAQFMCKVWRPNAVQVET